MILTYNQCLEKYGSDYHMKKIIDSGAIYKIEKGIYSDESHVSELAVITFKYPDAVFTLNSAFYFYDLTDVIPDHYYLATDRNASKIRDERVKQIFEHPVLVEIGLTTKIQKGVKIRIYDREKMLMELIRNKAKLPYDYYKELINRYRNIIGDLDIERIQDYATLLPKSKMLLETLKKEVF